MKLYYIKPNEISYPSWANFYLITTKKYYHLIWESKTLIEVIEHQEEIFKVVCEYFYQDQGMPRSSLPRNVTAQQFQNLLKKTIKELDLKWKAIPVEKLLTDKSAFLRNYVKRLLDSQTRFKT